MNSLVWYDKPDYQELLDKFLDGLPEGVETSESFYNLINYIWVTGYYEGLYDKGLNEK